MYRYVPGQIMRLKVQNKHHKTMKANITNLKKVLRICAKAHKCEFSDYSDEGQLLVGSETPGAICDVHMILDSFFGHHNAAENSGWGSITVWLDASMSRNKAEVDMDLLAMALPYGTKL